MAGTEAGGRDPERLLEESWGARAQRASRRELLTELAAAVLFVVAAGALLALPGATAGFAVGTAALLTALYAVVARVEFEVGAGHVVPTQLVLVPMLVLLPPATVPPLAAAALVANALWDAARGRGRLERALYSVPDAWHTIGCAAVLAAAGAPEPVLDDLPILAAAFAAGGVVDLASATVREAAANGIAPRLQLRVIALVWAVDACLAPIGFSVALASHHGLGVVLLVLPLGGLLLLLARDRRVRIEQAQRRLHLVRHERGRLQSAVRRMGDAFAAKLDLDALLDIVLRGSVEALDARGGRVELVGPEGRRALECGADGELPPVLRPGGAREPVQFQHHGSWVLALAFDVQSPSGPQHGLLSLARPERSFQEDEIALAAQLVGKARDAAGEILGHHLLRAQAMTDALTGLGNRRRLTLDLAARLDEAREPALLMLFDLDGFKHYNDTFGHLAGDALLARLGSRLADVVAPYGVAYRLGGDEFCVLGSVAAEHVDDALAAAGAALTEQGDEFTVGASCGVVVLPREADNPDRALQLADQRMYARKRGRASGPRDQARAVLMRTIEAKQPALDDHSSLVAELAARVARRLGLAGEELDEVTRAAELHDVGKVGIPDAILDKPAPLDPAEWEFIRQHTILGERILSAAPALRPVAVLVRASHERWDGAGYPDGLAGEQIPRGARIVAVCDAYEAMVSDRPYRTAIGHAAACTELRAEAGRQFDPAVVEAFLAEVDATRTDAAEPQDTVATHVRRLLGAA
jgi:diguanylate cyclase (GGDEF)-like protein